MAPTTDLSLLRAKLILACYDTVPPHIYNTTKLLHPNAWTEPWFKHDVKPRHVKLKPFKSDAGVGSSTQPIDLTTSSDKDDAEDEGDGFLWVCGDSHKATLKKVAAQRQRDRDRDREQSGRQNGRPTRSGKVEVVDSETEGEDELVSRYVVLDSQTWGLEEVASEEAARRRARNPPVEAGRGVLVFVKDTMHRCLEHGLRHGVRKKQERESPFTERRVPVNAGMMETQDEQAWSERKRLGIPDHVPVGSSLFYHVWTAVRELQEREMREVG